MGVKLSGLFTFPAVAMKIQDGSAHAEHIGAGLLYDDVITGAIKRTLKPCPIIGITPVKYLGVFLYNSC